MTWTLVVWLLTTGIASVTGLKNKSDCEQAGALIMKTEGSMYKKGFVCVEVRSFR